jgi:hypothetical protein
MRQNSSHALNAHVVEQHARRTSANSDRGEAEDLTLLRPVYRDMLSQLLYCEAGRLPPFDNGGRDIGREERDLTAFFVPVDLRELKLTEGAEDGQAWIIHRSRQDID